MVCGRHVGNGEDTEKSPMFSVTFQRSYKEGEGWRISTSFGRNNLLVLSLMAMRAFEWIASLPKTGQRRAWPARGWRWSSDIFVV